MTVVERRQHDSHRGFTSPDHPMTRSPDSSRSLTLSRDLAADRRDRVAAPAYPAIDSFSYGSERRGEEHDRRYRKPAVSRNARLQACNASEKHVHKRVVEHQDLEGRESAEGVAVKYEVQFLFPCFWGDAISIDCRLQRPPGKRLFRIGTHEPAPRRIEESAIAVVEDEGARLGPFHKRQK